MNSWIKWLLLSLFLLVLGVIQFIPGEAPAPTSSATSLPSPGENGDAIPEAH